MKLFLSKDNAIYYARANRSGNLDDRSECYQPPVIQVKPLIHLNIKDVKTGHIYVNEESRKIHSWTPYLEINSKDLMPIKYQLTSRDSGEFGRFIEYPAVKFEQSDKKSEVSNVSNNVLSFFKKHPIVTATAIGVTVATVLSTLARL